MTAPMTFVVTAAVALVAHLLFRQVWAALPRWGAGRVGQAAVLVAALALAVALVPRSDAGTLGFVAGGVVGPMLLMRKRSARR